MKKHAGSLAAFISVVIVGTAIMAGYRYFYRGGEDTTASIETTRLERGDIKRSVATSGAVRALVTVEVGSQLSGQIAELEADYNSSVTAGQLIARIDPKTFESGVRQGEADLKVAQANVKVRQAAVSRAAANLRRAALDYQRQRPLEKKGTISETALDATRASYESAQAEMEMARAELDNTRAAVEQRRAVLDSAKIDLERTYIRSPIDGVVIERSVDIGQTVAASLSSPVLFKIAQDLRKIRIEANVDEADIGNVKQGNAVSFTVDAYAEEHFGGSVEQVRLSPTELQNVVTYTVIISADNPHMKLLPGMTANVEIVTGKRENVLRVANEALRFRPRDAGEATAVLSAAASAGGPAGAAMDRLHTGLKNLGVTDQQMEEVEAQMRQAMAALHGHGQMQSGAGDPAAMRQHSSAERDRILRQVLTSAQFEQFTQTASTHTGTRRGELWFMSDDAKMRLRAVRLGLSDDDHTEILEGDVEAGAEVITRVRGQKP